MPSEALTPQRPPATPRISATSAAVAPPAAKPVEVLMKSAPAWMAISDAAQLLFHGEQCGFQNHLEQRAVMVRNRGRGVNGVVDGLVVAALELADGDHHVQFARAQPDQRGGLLAQR